MFIGSARVTKTQLSVGQNERDTKATHLEETDSGRLLAEALTAEVEAVFADKTSLVSTHTAMNVDVQSTMLHDVGIVSATDH